MPTHATVAMTRVATGGGRATRGTMIELICAIDRESGEDGIKGVVTLPTMTKMPMHGESPYDDHPED
jgi:hypothetical protein